MNCLLCLAADGHERPSHGKNTSQYTAAVLRHRERTCHTFCGHWVILTDWQRVWGSIFHRETDEHKFAFGAVEDGGAGKVVQLSGGISVIGSSENLPHPAASGLSYVPSHLSQRVAAVRRARHIAAWVITDLRACRFAVVCWRRDNERNNITKLFVQGGLLRYKLTEWWWWMSCKYCQNSESSAEFSHWCVRQLHRNQVDMMKTTSIHIVYLRALRQLHPEILISYYKLTSVEKNHHSTTAVLWVPSAQKLEVLSFCHHIWLVQKLNQSDYLVASEITESKIS